MDQAKSLSGLSFSAMAMEAAAAAARDSKADVGSDGGLRIFVSGGGCSGLRCGFSVDKREDGDVVLERDGLVFLIDGLSAQYLEDALIDCDDCDNGAVAGLTVKNASARTTCGCGSSF